MNHCIFLGRLTKDPEIRLSKESQIPIARFSIAVDRYRNKGGEVSADFFPCVLFDKKAEFAEKYLCSGMRVLISGNLQNRNYTNRAGEKVYGVELIGEDVEFADGKREKNESQASESQRANTAAQSAPGRSQAQTQAQRNQQSPAGGNGAVKNGRTKTNGNQGGAVSGGAARSAASRTAGKTQSSRYAGRTAGAASSSFMDIPTGIEDEGLPFN